MGGSIPNALSVGNEVTWRQKAKTENHALLQDEISKKQTRTSVLNPWLSFLPSFPFHENSPLYTYIVKIREHKTESIKFVVIFSQISPQKRKLNIWDRYETTINEFWYIFCIINDLMFTSYGVVAMKNQILWTHSLHILAHHASPQTHLESHEQDYK